MLADSGVATWPGEGVRGAAPPQPFSTENWKVQNFLFLFKGQTENKPKAFKIKIKQFFFCEFMKICIY